MSSGPQIPDANELSNAQTQSNIKTATAQTQLNQTNQSTPFGNLTYSQIGTNPDGTPRFQATTTLSPQLQQLLNTGMGTQQQIGNTAQTLGGQLGSSLSQPIGNFEQVRSDTLGALNSQLDERSGRDEESLRQQLANQGIQQGSQAYSNAMRDFNTGKSANRTNAILAANQAQGQAQDLAFGGRNQSINELLSLLGGTQVQQPNFGQTPQTGIPGTDVTGNAWNQYSAQQNQSNQFYNGLGALGGTIGGWLFSDRRLKEDVHSTGEKTPGGVPIKTWRYKGSPMLHRGYVAQDVLKSGQSDAVAKTPGGFLAVDYRRVR